MDNGRFSCASRVGDGRRETVLLKKQPRAFTFDFSGPRPRDVAAAAAATEEEKFLLEIDPHSCSENTANMVRRAFAMPPRKGMLGRPAPSAGAQKTQVEAAPRAGKGHVSAAPRAKMRHDLN